MLVSKWKDASQMPQTASTVPSECCTAIGDLVTAFQRLLALASLCGCGTAAEPKSVNTQVEDSVPNAETHFICAIWAVYSHK